MMEVQEVRPCVMAQAVQHSQGSQIWFETKLVVVEVVGV